jgi:hypothetical protein
MLTTISSDVRDRVPSGRFVRNLALSLSGGALLTLLGAGVAHANEAGTASDGSGTAGTGDATAVGNRSGTQATQGGQASTSGSNLQIVNQNAGVANVGVAVANTGGNVAVGNSSNNVATAAQVSNGGPLGLSVNNGNASNASDGHGFIQTGDAYAIGNESGTTIDQRFDASAHGSLGGVLVLTQNAGVANIGIGVANTGGNRALGNGSGDTGTPRAGNSAGLLQDALNTSDLGGGATNSGSASNDSNGKAVISTGNASATGNRADTKVSQVAGSGDGDGPDPSGLTVITQVGGALNLGVGRANTGANRAAGNLSLSSSDVTGPLLSASGAPGQAAETDVDGIGFANNNGSATNASDGSAWITTGDATSLGNDSRTVIAQDAQAEFGDQGVNIQTQLAPVLNIGVGTANTGRNTAIGNQSRNDADISQDADLSNGLIPINEPVLLGIANNSGEAANSSNGSASITTGDAWARGNWSTTDVAQQTEADGTALAVQTQAELVANVGVARANTGRNTAIGNQSLNDAELIQSADLGLGIAPVLPVGLATVNNSGSAANDSDGSATISTGNAYASGNESTTRVRQAIDPTGFAIQTQLGAVANVGIALSNTGLNRAVGNQSDNSGGNGATLNQDLDVGSLAVLAGVITATNQGEAANTSDGSASITTGDAWSLGNHSDTDLTQAATASVDGLGAAVNTQVGVVGNVGLGVANTGVNGAIGNDSDNRAEGVQDNDVATLFVGTGVLTASNSASVTNDTDGTATITTGDATATGNRSKTDFRQEATAAVPGLGIVVNTQAGGVLNAGVGVANTGVNGAIGNASDSETFLNQAAHIGNGPGVADPGVAALTLLAPVVTNSNAGQASNASDGTGEIHTGDAMATGNASDTRFAQRMDGNVDGLGAVVNTQVGGVANVGIGVANSGVNGAIGNASNNDAGDALVPAPNGGPAPGVFQHADIGSPTGLHTIAALGPVTNSNSGRSANSSDGWGYIHTGDTQAQGNVSTTDFSQEMHGSVGEDGLGVVPNVQAAGVLNLGVGVANSGINGAVGNASGTTTTPLVAPFGPPGTEANQANLTQTSQVLPDSAVDLTVLGPLTNANQGEASNSSDGTAKVFTGDALATGNVSTSNLSQRLDADVDGSGLVVGPQLGLIANVGIGVANSGINGSVGNLSNNQATTTQTSTFDPNGDLTVFGPVTVGSSGGVATNASDGDSCVCTGNAVATGNVSTSTLSQDLVIGVDDGLSVVPMTGTILNAGFGLANSGVNAAIGNVSQNRAVATQTATLDPTVASPLFGPQTIVNGGGSENASAGTGKVGTGNAKADGNISTSDLTQAVNVDGAGAFALVNGGIGNVGLGVANAGVNLGVGNASRNDAALTQSAIGAGTVANQGKASNRSDGFGGVGDPNCDIPGEETPGTPGVPSLPKTGGPLEIEAAIGLMLLLAGFGFRRVGKAAAERA